MSVGELLDTDAYTMQEDRGVVSNCRSSFGRAEVVGGVGDAPTAVKNNIEHVLF